MTKDTILILSNSEDGMHTDEVVKQLLAKGEKIFRLDVDTISGGETTTTFFTDNNSFSFVFKNATQEVHSDQIKSVWYRRAKQFNFFITDPEQKKFAEREMLAFLEGLWASLRDVFWLNTPNAIEQANKKIFQLQLAKEIGFEIPKTLITNDPKIAKVFIEENDSVVSKSLTPAFFDYGEEKFAATTTSITEEHLDSLDLIKVLPSGFQVEIQKEYELRITVIGKEVYAFKIDSQVFTETSTDWRNPEFLDQIPHSLVILPEDIQNKCLELIERLHLGYGAIDMIVDKEGNYVFLEINPNGQWYWLEDLTKVPLTQKIAESLARASFET